MAMTKKTHLRSSAYIVFYICAHVHFFTNAKIAQVLPCTILRNVFYFTHETCASLHRLKICGVFVKSKRSARIESVVRVEVLFERFENVERRRADAAFEIRRKKLAYAVMVRKRRTRFHDCFKD